MATRSEICGRLIIAIYKGLLNNIVIFLLFTLASFSIAFSATTDVDDVNTVVKIWKEVQVYVDTSTFYYGMGVNQHHTDYIGHKILGKYGIKKSEDYIVGVIGTPDYKPLYVAVIFVMNGQEYEKIFEIKNVELKDGCEDLNNCA